MAAPEGKSLLLLIRHSPYGSSLARASIDVALAAAAFDQAVSLLFVGDGVLQLLPDQDGEERGVRNLGRLLTSLPLYDIEQVYVDAEAAARYRLDLDAAPVTANALDREAMSQLLLSHDHLLGF
jgi:tRNA 2-thiouridine synthesizing protein C